MVRRSRFSRTRTSTIKNIVLIVIFALIITVGVAIVAAFLSQPELQIKQKFETIANNYYENTIYESILSSDQFSGNPADALEKNSGRGLALVTLRQIILLDETVPADVASYLEKYCDINKTFVRFYPQSPFSRTDYRAEYTYDCNF